MDRRRTRRTLLLAGLFAAVVVTSVVAWRHRRAVETAPPVGAQPAVALQPAQHGPAGESSVPGGASLAPRDVASSDSSSSAADVEVASSQHGEADELDGPACSPGARGRTFDEVAACIAWARSSLEAPWWLHARLLAELSALGTSDALDLLATLYS